ncbi:hypothetical protein K1W69_11215 [Hoeflea sp. WL0058]|uniref:Uncharacterized protein n=1 Tax=Flavimaribacter sediminis TaxID=2865987 RepID=A0AAE2ZQE9_9HYPH|nr:hypothetical protein [Flavimaribacter sediminis]MBW8637757.1 hypothetical protein [Flavimaribacter sediminis]
MTNSEETPERDDRMKAALLDPEAVFGAPENVPGHADYSKDEKIAILRQWEYDATEEDVALEEGMPGDENGMLRRVLIVLGELAGPLDMKRVSPTKQHGLRSTKNGDSD